MNSRFYILGGIISIVLHGAFFALLGLGSCNGKHPEAPSPKPEVANEVKSDSPSPAKHEKAESIAKNQKHADVSRTDTRTEEEIDKELRAIENAERGHKYARRPRPEEPPKEAERPSKPPVAKAKEPKVSETPPPKAAEEAPRAWKTYVVKSGDTLMKLSKKAGCSVSEIAKKNKKTVNQMKNLKVGQRIMLPIE